MHLLYRLDTSGLDRVTMVHVSLDILYQIKITNNKMYSKNSQNQEETCKRSCYLEMSTAGSQLRKGNENIKSSCMPEELLKDKRSQWGKQTIKAGN